MNSPISDARHAAFLWGVPESQRPVSCRIYPGGTRGVRVRNLSPVLKQSDVWQRRRFEPPVASARTPNSGFDSRDRGQYADNGARVARLHRWPQ